METRTVVLIGFDGVTALDVIGPLEVLTAAQHYLDPQSHAFRYRCIVAGITRRAFRAESGVMLVPTNTLRELRSVDTAIIPGGMGLRATKVNEAVSQWVLARAEKIRRIASVCTGIYGLAPTGLLDGKRAATHWQFAAD